ANRLDVKGYPTFVKNYFQKSVPPPSLTQVLLEELFRKEGLRVLHMSVSEVHERPWFLRRSLARASTVLISTTLLHDLSELGPIVSRVKRSWNRVVVGG